MLANIGIVDGVVDNCVFDRADWLSNHAPALAHVILDHARAVLAMGGECLLNLRDLGPAADTVSDVLRSTR